MRSGVYAVGGDFVFDNRLVLQLEVFLGGGAGNGALREYHDAGMAGADTQFILCADHAEAFHAANLGLLDFEVSGEHGANLGEEHFLPGGHVGRTANHLYRLRGAVVHGGNMQMVAVRMGIAGKDLGHNDMVQSAVLHFYGIHLNADGRHGLRHLLRGEVALEILFEPVVRNFHNAIVYLPI